MKEQKIDTSEVADYPSKKGKTTITPEVLETIARLTALSVPGVSRMAEAPGSVDKIFRRGLPDGVRIVVELDIVTFDLYLVLKNDVSILDVSRNVQRNVCRAISEMVGMTVDWVNIHVEDIYFPETPGQAKEA